MKPIALVLLAILLTTNFYTHAGQFTSIPIVENGVITEYFSVPANTQCNIKVPDMPTAICAGPNGRYYHHFSQFFKQAIDPQEVVNYLIQQARSSDPDMRLVNQYNIPTITRHVLQQGSQLLFKQGEQVVTYALDTEDPKKNQKSVSALIFSFLPNNGSPVSTLRALGYTVPLSSGKSFDDIRQELIRYAHSYQYDNNWMQMANNQHAQFLNNLSAREQANFRRQQQIHQSNMNALDQSFNRYQQNSAASDRAQSQYIDSIHDRQLMTDPNTGTQYQVEGYYDYNYVNPNDPQMYYQSNDPNFNPNINNNQGEHYIQLE